MNIFRLLGVLGLICITSGVLMRRRRRQDILYIAGGLCLGAYSLYLGDAIFSLLQVVFLIAAIFDYIEHLKKKSSL